MQDTKLSQVDVVRIVKCLGHGCSVKATADICEVDTRTVQRLLEKSGKRAADFHRLASTCILYGTRYSGRFVDCKRAPTSEGEE